MKITTKINLLTTAVLLCIMLLINTVVFFLFIKSTVTMEEEVQYQKAEKIISDLNTIQTASEIEQKLKENLTMYSYIRIIRPENKIIYEASNDLLLTNKINGKYTESNQAETHIISAERGEERVLIIRVPINRGNEVIGSLEVGERLIGLEKRAEILRGILVGCTVLAAFLSLIGGKWLANIIMRPIFSMIKTMEEIEQSGVLKKITLQNKSNDELQIMAKTFNRMIDRIQVNLEKQKQFISDASHELKTPLTVIKSYANFLRRHGLENNEMTKEAIHAIHSEATTIQKMTETFLELATLEKENVLEMKEVNLVSLCQNTLNQLRDVFNREITLHYQDNSITIFADELKIKQVMIILLDNALKYSHDRIQIFLEKNDQQAIICVKDYGIGIPQYEMNNIFERFYRVDKARSRETGGTGLGLSIAKSIIAQHNGEIKVNSKEGIGTEIEIFLPISKLI